MNFDFGEVLARAWKIIWKHKVLWIFGVLASCGSAGNGNSSGNSRSGNYGQNDLLSNEIIRDIVVFINQSVSWFKENPWVIIAVIVFLVVAGLIQFTLANIGHIGLIRGAYRADLGAEKIGLGELWSESLGYFWRVIGLSLAVWGPIWIVLIGLGAAFIFSMQGQPPYGREEEFLVGFGLFFIALCCCLLPVMIALGLFYSQALRALTLEDLGVFDSLKRGWQVLVKNILGLILMGIVLFIINLVLDVIIALPVYIAVLPLVFKFVAGSVDTWQPVIVTLAILCAYSPLAWLLRGIIMSYIQTVWTLVYARVTVIKKDEPILIEAHA